MTSNSSLALVGRVLKKWLIFSLCLALWTSAFASDPLAPKRAITGKVTDNSTSEPLPGVNIVIEGTTLGTVTNTEGNYTIEVSKPEAVLVFSYVGYTLERVPVGANSVINVKLKADDRKLDEVVVVGYGSQKKE
jgi:hypothetical protein